MPCKIPLVTFITERIACPGTNVNRYLKDGLFIHIGLLCSCLKAVEVRTVWPKKFNAETWKLQHLKSHTCSTTSPHDSLNWIESLSYLKILM